MITTLRDHFKQLTSTRLKEWKRSNISEMPQGYFYAEIQEVSNVEVLEHYSELTLPITLYVNASAKSDEIRHHDELFSQMENIRKQVTVKMEDNLGAIKEIRCLSWNKNKDEFQGNEYKFEFNFECIYKSTD